MMPELKPCPFCGGRAEFHIYGRSCNVMCDDCKIGTRLEHIDEYEVAVDAWNTRAERTCKMNRVKVFPEYEDCIFECWECSVCKGTNGEQQARYCPRCGAKVVSE